MDKRTLILFASLMLSFFVVNTYFTHQRDQNNLEWLEQKKQEKLKEKNRLIESIRTQTAPAEALPISPLFSDKEQQTLVGRGLRYGNHLLVLPWEKVLPSAVYTSQGEKFLLVAEGKKGFSPALYSTETTSSPLTVKDLPEFSSYNLQLVFTLGKATDPLEITFGEFRNGIVTLPIDTLAKEYPDEYSSQAPKGTALAVVKMDDAYLPVGTYSAADQTFHPIQSFSYLQDHVTQPPVKAISEGDEKFFVLQNGYQQLVFSNIGGAIAEINLPFHSEKDPESIVKEIGFDREMVEYHPQNALFPGHSYYTPPTTTGGEADYHEQGELGNYYPLLRRNLVQNPPRKTIAIDPAFYGLNIVSKYPEVAHQIYQVTYYDAQKIVFEAKTPHRKITKTFALSPEGSEAPYCIDLTIEIEGDSRGLWLFSGVPDVEWISGAIAPALKYRVLRSAKDSQVKTISLPDGVVDDSTESDWICNSNGFFGLILDPLSNRDETGFKAEKISGTVVPSRLLLIDQEYDRFTPEALPGYAMLLPLSERGGTTHLRLFTGPFATETLKTVDATFSNPATGYTPDYIEAQTFHGYFTFITQPISKFLLLILRAVYSFTHSWGFSIIILTIILRLMLHPFTAWSNRSMMTMRKIAPELKKIQDKYKKDPKRLQMETAKLYKEKGINPFGGCLPMLLQLPFLVGMFDLLKSTFELRGASFIPGWIDNLAAPDVLFSWHYPIFFIGTEFHLLPILLGLTMWIQQKMSAMTQQDPSQMTDQQRQQQSMMSIMSIFFTVMFYHFPSGLNIYWLSSMLVGIAQQWWLNKKAAKEEELQTSPVPAKAQGKKKKNK